MDTTLYGSYGSSYGCWNLAGSRDLRRRCGDERYNAKGSSRKHMMGQSSLLCFQAVSFVGMGGFFRRTTWHRRTFDFKVSDK